MENEYSHPLKVNTAAVGTDRQRVPPHTAFSLKHMKIPCYICLILFLGVRYLYGVKGLTSYLRVNRRRAHNVIVLARDSWPAKAKKVVGLLPFPLSLHRPSIHPSIDAITILTPSCVVVGLQNFGCPDDYCSSDHWTTIDN